METVIENKSKIVSFLGQAEKNIKSMADLQTFSSCFVWADRRVRVVLVGVQDTRFFTDAIFHCLVGDDVAASEELAVYVVDQSIAASVMPDPFWNKEDFDLYGRMQDVQEDEFVEYISDNRILIVLNRSLGICIVWVRDVAQLPEWERSFPFRTVLFQWFKNSRFLFVHAGAVGNENGGVLLTGKGGSGKSTATLACLDSDLKYAGDDFVMVDTESMEVHCLYNVAKLEASNVHRFPELTPYIANPEAMPQDKGQLFLHFFKPETIIHSFRLKAIFMPKFTGKENTSIRPATKGDALLALAPSTIGLLKADAQMLSRITRLIHKLPCYWIETGTNLDSIPNTISHWLNSEANV